MIARLQALVNHCVEARSAMAPRSPAVTNPEADTIARRLPQPPHRLDLLQPRRQNQARPRNNHPRLPIQGRHHRRRRFASYSRKLHCQWNSQEGYRDQPLPAGYDGGWCGRLPVLVSCISKAKGRADRTGKHTSVCSVGFMNSGTRSGYRSLLRARS